MTREEREIIEAIKSMGYDRTAYPREKVSAVISMAIEALSERTGEWLFNPKDAIELMFTKPKCSKCGFESADGGNFCSNCGARMTPYMRGDTE